MTLSLSDKGLYNFNAISRQQAEFFDCEAMYPAFCAGFGGGKSHVGACKMAFNLLWKYIGHNGLAIAPTFGDLETIVVPELESRFGDIGIDLKMGGWSSKYLHFTLEVNGRAKKIKIHLRSGEKPERIAGFEVSTVWIDEAGRVPTSDNPLRDVKKQAIARIRGVGLEEFGTGQLFVTSTHEGEVTWLYQDWCEEPKPDHVYFQGSTLDNQYMRNYGKNLLRQYDKRLAEQYVLGNAVNLAGNLVYYSFDNLPFPDGNIDDSVKINPHLPVGLALDFNAAPGMHGIVLQHHAGSDEVHVIDEIHGVGMHVIRLVEEYHRLYGNNAITTVYGDATGRARDTAVGETAYDWVQRCFQSNQMVVTLIVPNSNPVREDRFISMNAGLEDGTGTRHIRIHSRCRRLIRDLRSVQRNERGVIDKTQEDKGYVHASDALGYAIHEIRPVTRSFVGGLTAR